VLPPPASPCWPAAPSPGTHINRGPAVTSIFPPLEFTHQGGNLRDLQLTAQIGEGGFARVFRGLWRGQVVAVKVVASGGPGNERSVMKNAHEIAILSALSHPNILQVRAAGGRARTAAWGPAGCQPVRLAPA
jgi:hypothetical protein